MTELFSVIVRHMYSSICTVYVCKEHSTDVYAMSNQLPYSLNIYDIHQENKKKNSPPSRAITENIMKELGNREGTQHTQQSLISSNI